MKGLTFIKNCLVTIIVSILLLPSCGKKSKTIPIAPTNNTPTENTDTIEITKMNGTWIAIGKAYGTGPGVDPLPPDAFNQFEVIVINKKLIVVYNNTLSYKSFDTGVLTYEVDNSDGFKINNSSLSYNTANNDITYSGQSTASGASVGLSLSTSYYKPNPLLKDYLPKIVGVKSLSGIVHDYFIMRNPHDSTFTINVNITFTAINDSTLAFDNDVLKLGDNTLHYKATDYTQKKVIFQNFHSFSYSLSTLTYYYEADSITFEQEFKTAPPQTRSVVLQ